MMLSTNSAAHQRLVLYTRHGSSQLSLLRFLFSSNSGGGRRRRSIVAVVVVAAAAAAAAVAAAKSKTNTNYL